LTGECSDCEHGYEKRAGNCFAEATAVPTIRPTSKSQVSSSPTTAATSKPQVSPATSKPQGVTPPIVFSLQLSGVTVASLNNNTVRSKIISSIATVFNVAASQVNVAVVASGSRRSSRILNTESVNLQVTITDLTAQQATHVMEIISSPTAQSQLQESIRKSSPALSAVTVVSLTGPTLLSTKQPTSKTSLKSTRQPTKQMITIELAKPATSNSLSARDKKIIGGVVGGVGGAVLVAVAIWLLKDKDCKTSKPLQGGNDRNESSANENHSDGQNLNRKGGNGSEVGSGANENRSESRKVNRKGGNSEHANRSEVRNSLNADLLPSEERNVPDTMYQAGVVPQIVFSLQLSGVSLNENIIQKIIKSIFKVFQVKEDQVNVTVLASGSRTSNSTHNTESEILLTTITDLTAEEATNVIEIISSTARSQLQESLRKHSPPLSAVTIESLTVFALQLSGVDVARLKGNTIKSNIISSIATQFKVKESQVNVTVVASGPRRSGSIPNTESETVLATLTDLNSQQAISVMQLIIFPATRSQLQESIRNSSPALLGGVTVVSLTEDGKGPTTNVNRPEVGINPNAKSPEDGNSVRQLC